MRRTCLLAALTALAGCAALGRPPEPLPPREAFEEDAADRAGDASEADLPEPGVEEHAAAEEPPEAGRAAGALDEGLRARLVSRARSLLARRGPFQAAGRRFNGDCSGYVQSVFAAEGIDLRGLVERTAPRERRGVVAMWHAAREHGSAWGEEEPPAPGDLVFWHDTYDRNRNGKADDPLTHVGIVERVDEDGTVSFLHRGAKGVAGGVMTLARRRVATASDGRPLNSTLRARSHPVRKGGLAGELFAGYARFGATAVAAAGSAPGRGASPAPGERRATAGRPPAGNSGRALDFSLR